MNTVTADRQDRLANLPRFEIISKLDNIPNLSHFDVERNFLQEVNFGYYTPEQFCSKEDIKQSSQNNSFSAIHCNIRSLSANYDDLTMLLTDLCYPFNVIGLSETKIKQGVGQICNTSLPGYDFISQPTLSNAGGVGFYVKHGMQYHIRDDISSITEEYETLLIEINCKSSKNIVCAVIYRHPNGKLEKFNDYLFSVVDRISKEKKLCIFMGDINIDLLNFDTCSLTQDFVNTLGTYYVLPQIIQPTRITDHTATLIDNIFLSSTEHSSISGNIVHDITDHLPNFLIISKQSSFSQKQKVYKRDYSKLNEDDLLKDVQSINWHEVLQSEDDVNQIFNSFHSRISSIIDKHAPLKKLSNREMKIRTKPWITPGLRKSVATKNKLYHTYLNNKCEFNHSRFKMYRNKLKHLCRSQC